MGDIHVHKGGRMHPRDEEFTRMSYGKVDGTSPRRVKATPFQTKRGVQSCQQGLSNDTPQTAE